MCGQILVVFDPYRRWTNYSNPGQLYPPRPPNFKVVFFLQGLRRVDKTNQTPQHDTSRTRCLTLTFGGRGCRPILSSGFEEFVHLRYQRYGLFRCQVDSLMKLKAQTRAAKEVMEAEAHQGVDFLGGCFVVSLFRCFLAFPKSFLFQVDGDEKIFEVSDSRMPM